VRRRRPNPLTVPAWERPSPIDNLFHEPEANPESVATEGFSLGHRSGSSHLTICGDSGTPPAVRGNTVMCGIEWRQEFTQLAAVLCLPDLLANFDLGRFSGCKQGPCHTF